MTISDGDAYRPEVEDKAYELHWLLNNSYYLMYRVERNTNTGVPRSKDG